MKAIKDFIHHESTSGLMLIAAAIIALMMANSPLAGVYGGFLDTLVAIKVGTFEISKPLLLWINDGLMAVFFFLIGLEVKRELLDGELSSKERAMLPLMAAIGGLIIPAAVFYFFNQDNPEALKGWAVPAATDIAFALGILALVGRNIPSSLKILLLSIAIIDDIAAVLIIAIFYTSDVSLFSLGLAAFGFLFAVGFNMYGVKRITPYILVAVFMWVCVLKSGVHATIAGIMVALTIPLTAKNEKGKKLKSPLKGLEHMLHPWVAYFIMPIFAFANAGVSLAGVTFATLSATLPIGIMAGLIVGKQVGVFFFIALAVMLRICKLPADMGWRHVYGLSCLCGIGFTMSLFIGTLAFEDPVMGTQVRIAVLIASAVSAVLGYSVLKLSGKK